MANLWDIKIPRSKMAGIKSKRMFCDTVDYFSAADFEGLAETDSDPEDPVHLSFSDDDHKDQKNCRCRCHKALLESAEMEAKKPKVNKTEEQKRAQKTAKQKTDRRRKKDYLSCVKDGYAKLLEPQIKIIKKHVEEISHGSRRRNLYRLLEKFGRVFGCEFVVYRRICDSDAIERADPAIVFSFDIEQELKESFTFTEGIAVDHLTRVSNARPPEKFIKRKAKDLPMADKPKRFKPRPIKVVESDEEDIDDD